MYILLRSSESEVSEKFRRCQDGLTLMQTMLHEYEEMQMRLKSQDEELEHFHALEKERHEHFVAPFYLHKAEGKRRRVCHF